MRTRTTLATSLASLALIALAGLTGCGSDDSDGGDAGDAATAGSSGEKVLTKAQARSALLTADDLGKGFRVDDSDDDDSGGLGCLDKLDDIDKIADAKVDVDVSYEADTDFALPGVMSSIGSFESTATAKRNFAEARKVLDACTAVDETDEDGAHYKLTVGYDEEKTDPAVDEQLNIKAGGFIEVEGVKVPMAVHVSVARIGNDGVMAGFVTVARDASAEARKVVEAALTRFIPVTQGKKAVAPEPLNLEPADPSALLAGAA